MCGNWISTEDCIPSSRSSSITNISRSNSINSIWTMKSSSIIRSSSSNSIISSSSSSSNSIIRSSSNDNACSNQSIAVTCVICSERYKRLDNIYAGKCGHVFHWDCLERWLEESQECPVCRSTDADYFKIFLAFDENDQSENPDPRSGQEDNEESNNDSGDAQDLQNLILEAELYRDEIEYLNNRIKHLTTIITE